MQIVRYRFPALRCVRGALRAGEGLVYRRRDVPTSRRDVSHVLTTLAGARFRDTPISPPQLEWTNPPDGTQSFMLLVEDPNAGSLARRKSVVLSAYSVCSRL